MIITLCGSTKYKLEFEFTAKYLIEQGYFVHSLEIYSQADGIKISNEYKEWLGKLHQWKIDRSDAIFIIDKDNYIGENTRKEIEYATKKGLSIMYYSNLFKEN